MENSSMREGLDHIGLLESHVCLASIPLLDRRKAYEFEEPLTKQASKTSLGKRPRQSDYMALHDDHRANVSTLVIMKLNGLPCLRDQRITKRGGTSISMRSQSM
ncbi:hypothetical protein ACE6H2_006548 [Prunus campanulata]